MATQPTNQPQDPSAAGPPAQGSAAEARSTPKKPARAHPLRRRANMPDEPIAERTETKSVEQVMKEMRYDELVKRRKGGLREHGVFRGYATREDERRAVNARNRAVGRLIRLYPDHYADLLADEREKVGLKPQRQRSAKLLRTARHPGPRGVAPGAHLLDTHGAIDGAGAERPSEATCDHPSTVRKPYGVFCERCSIQLDAVG